MVMDFLEMLQQLVAAIDQLSQMFAASLAAQTRPFPTPPVDMQRLSGLQGA